MVVSIVAIATLKCFIGISLVAGRWMRLAIWLLAIQFVGILSPLVLLPERLFAGPDGAPTLEGQYVLKDVILVAAGMVIRASAPRCALLPVRRQAGHSQPVRQGDHGNGRGAPAPRGHHQTSHRGSGNRAYHQPP